MHREAGRFVYELIYDGEGGDGAPFVMGLIDADALETCMYDANRSGLNGERSGVNQNRSAPGRGEVAPVSGGSRDGKIAESPSAATPCEQNSATAPKTHVTGRSNGAVPYVHPSYAHEGVG